MEPLLELERIGYEATLKDDGQGISLKYKGEGKPDPDQVKPLIEEIKQRKQEAISYLMQQEPGHKKEARKIEKLLEEKGFAKINSATLGEVVIFARDDKAAQKAPTGYVVYTMPEIRHLIELKTDPEGLRRIHEAKKVFPGGYLMELN